MFRRPASLGGVAVEGRSPRVVGTTGTLRLPAIPPAALGLPSLGGTTAASAGSLPRDGRTRRRGAGMLSGAAIPCAAGGVRGNGRTSQVPAETLAAARVLLRPRKNRAGLALSPRPARPRVRERPWLLRLDFRGSIAWLDDSLSTLRAGALPPGTQDSLPAAWLRSAGRGLHPLGFPEERFQLCVSFTYHPPLASLLGAIPLCFPGISRAARRRRGWRTCR